MKKHLLLFIFLLSITFSFSQNFYKVGAKLMTEEKYYSDLEIVKKEQTPKYISLQVYEEVTRNNSLLKNIKPIVYENKAMALNTYFMLLNKPFTDFKLQGINNYWYSKSRF